MASDEEPVNPFEFLLNDLVRAMSAEGADPSRVRDQLARVALGATPSLSATERAPLEDLGLVVARYLPESSIAAQVVPDPSPLVRAQHPSDVYAELVSELGPYLELFEQSVGAAFVPGGAVEASGTLVAQMLPLVSERLGPLVVNAQLGSLLGHYSSSCLIRCELVVPRAQRAGATLAAAAVRQVASELGVSVEELGLWLAFDDVLRGALLANPVVVDRLDVELRLFLLDLRADVDALSEHLRGRWSELGAERPGELFGLGVAEWLNRDESEAQRANRRELQTTAAFVVGVSLAALEQLRPRLFGHGAWIKGLTDLREHRSAVVALAELFGMDVAAITATAERFAVALSQRDDAPELVARALRDADAFPTHDELAAPDRWAERLEAQEPRR